MYPKGKESSCPSSLDDILKDYRVDRGNEQRQEVQAIIVAFWNNAFKVACIEKVEHVVIGNRADTNQDQTDPMDRCGWDRKVQVLEIEPELSAKCRQDISDVCEEVIKAVSQLSGKGEGHQDRDHWRELAEQGVFGCIEKVCPNPYDE
jgi:hypothetical protein